MAKKNASNKVESIRHKDKRKNIPTEELRDFVAEDENAPKTMLYPRDPSLDPQSVWKGKDEQDQKDLAVPVVPIYIQEKIHPLAIIDTLPRIDHSAGQLDLFADFNGLPEEFDQRVDFYQHEGNWSNRMILGDSLLVMTSLAEKEGLKGKVQTIYLDPPYGIKFGSNWQVSTRKRDVKDGKAKNYVPDFIACIDDGHGPDDLLNLLIEVAGEKKKDKAAKVATARTLWVPAVNNHGGLGRWMFVEVDDPWNAENLILSSSGDFDGKHN
jgi:hypothetical protein